MITVHKSHDRGHTHIGWLDSYHSFSFGEYVNPKQTHFRTLRVINEDRIEPGQGFETHSHQDMEIITYMIEGAIEHRDSAGNVGVIKKGDIQRMSAGTGISHSEFNKLDNVRTHLLQIWIFPADKGLKPSYEQISVGSAGNRNCLRLIASPDGGENALTLHQDVKLYDSWLEAKKVYVHTIDHECGVWIQMIQGHLDVNGTEIAGGDAVAITRETKIELRTHAFAEFLLFDIA